MSTRESDEIRLELERDCSATFTAYLKAKRDLAKVQNVYWKALRESDVAREAQHDFYDKLRRRNDRENSNS